MLHHDKSGGRFEELWFADDHAAIFRAHGLDTLAALFNDRGAERLDKPGLATWRQRWRMTLQSADSRLVFYMKRFTNPPPAAGREIRRCGSGARSLAGNELEWIRRLEAAGIACVVPVAFGQEVRGGRELRSVLITRAVEGSSLETWAATAHATDRAVVQMLIRQTADLARRLHGLGMVHRDLYLSHIYFDPVSQSLRLIDLQRVLRPVWRLSRWRVKDLAALNYSAPRPLISSADRLRWLREYLGTAKLGAAGKQWAYRVAGKTSRIARRDPRIARSGKT